MHAQFMTLPPRVVSSKRGAYCLQPRLLFTRLGTAGRDANAWYLVSGLLFKTSLVNEPHHSSSVLENTQTCDMEASLGCCCSKGGSVFIANELSIFF